MGFTSGGPGVAQGGEDDENSLSPEACYECKINGYPKKGRKRRSTNSTQEDPLEDMQVICLYAWLKLTLMSSVLFHGTLGFYHRLYEKMDVVFKTSLIGFRCCHHPGSA